MNQIQLSLPKDESDIQDYVNCSGDKLLESEGGAGKELNNSLEGVQFLEPLTKENNMP